MEFFLARQPIFDQDRRVFGYEMLFRSSPRNAYDGDQAARAGSSVILNSFFSSLALEDVLDGKRAFFNFDRALLMDELALLLPPDRVVIEILETITPDGEIVARCRHLKQKGYTLALDDYVDGPAYAPLLELADIVKIDVLSTPPSEQRRLVNRLARRGTVMLAEKIETPEMFGQAREIGYQYFQGYFFARPAVLRGREVPGLKVNYARLLKELNAPRLDIANLEKILRQDVALSYRLFRYLSSPLFGFRRQIASLPQALMLVGEASLRKWFSLAVLGGLGEDQPRELVISALLRAFFCESMAESSGAGERRGEMFLLGLFSHLDAFLDRPIGEALREVDVPDSIAQILSGTPGAPREMAEIYRKVCDYQRGAWNGGGQAEMPSLYLKALHDIRQIFLT